MAALLQGLMAPENEIRSQAETAFAELKKHPDACVGKLIQQLRTNADPSSRSLAAVLLRKVDGRAGGGWSSGAVAARLRRRHWPLSFVD